MSGDDVDGEPHVRSSSVRTVTKAFAILEVVAERQGASARDISESLGYPLPTVYRLAQALVQSDYLVHIRGDQRFELGYKIESLGVSLRRQVGVPRFVMAETQRLHEIAATAAYFAVYRGADVVVAFVADSLHHPRLTPLEFGFHGAAHATAFGKIMLAGMSSEDISQYLSVHGMPRMTAATIGTENELSAHLAEVSQHGIAWEREEFLEGTTCAAVAVRNRTGAIVGAMAISAPSSEMNPQRERELEGHLRSASNSVSRYYRSGETRGPER